MPNKKKIKENSKQFFTLFLITLVIGTVAVLGMIKILSNLDILWSFFNPEEAAVKVDQIAPSAPVIIPVQKYTNKSEITIVGYTEKGATVILFSGNLKKREVIVDNDGRFAFNEIPLSGKQNRFYLTAKDKSDNESEKSEEILVIFDNEKPKLEINEPINGSRFVGEDKKQVNIAGTTELGGVIFVNDAYAIVNSAGNFTYTFTLTQGENKIKIKAEDQAGNEENRELTIFFSP